MRWNFEGADAKTGKERVIQVDADNRAEAEYVARKQGLLVSAVLQSSVKPSTQTIADPIDDRPSPQIDFTPPAPLEYRTPQKKRLRPVPGYSGLRIAATVIGGFALL